MQLYSCLLCHLLLHRSTYTAQPMFLIPTMLIKFLYICMLSDQHFETRDAGSISNLELQDLISHLIRRGNNSGGKSSGRARKNLKANSRPSHH
ncbi:hypothetical protein C8Q75DRAFT_373797 [Abortiporus biennis]|nr:hypothetical protein C8Q75DRAFT_373797 [Abortiporus biennis]